MARYFDEVVAQAPRGEKSAWRAIQAWQILVARAELRRTITYGELAKLLGYEDARPLPDILGHILHHCQQHNLPPLTALVIKKETGLPGTGLGIAAEAIPTEQNKVFQYNWFGIVPPGVAELREAYAAASGREHPPEIAS